VAQTTSASDQGADQTLQEDWIKTLHWDLPETVDGLIWALGAANLDRAAQVTSLRSLMELPAWKACPKKLASQVQLFIAANEARDAGAPYATVAGSQGVPTLDHGTEGDVVATKEEAHYRLTYNPAVSCHQCMYRVDNGDQFESTCLRVEGTVDPQHVCDFVELPAAPDYSTTSNVSDARVRVVIGLKRSDPRIQTDDGGGLGVDDTNKPCHCGECTDPDCPCECHDLIEESDESYDDDAGI
jgi:hypothetical protein